MAFGPEDILPAIQDAFGIGNQALGGIASLTSLEDLINFRQDPRFAAFLNQQAQQLAQQQAGQGQLGGFNDLFAQQATDLLSNNPANAALSNLGALRGLQAPGLASADALLSGQAGAGLNPAQTVGQGPGGIGTSGPVNLESFGQPALRPGTEFDPNTNPFGFDLARPAPEGSQIGEGLLDFLRNFGQGGGGDPPLDDNDPPTDTVDLSSGEVDIFGDISAQNPAIQDFLTRLFGFIQGEGNQDPSAEASDPKSAIPEVVNQAGGAQQQAATGTPLPQRDPGEVAARDAQEEAFRQAEIARLAQEAQARNTPTQAELDAAQGIVQPVDPNQFKTPKPNVTPGTVQPPTTGPGGGPVAETGQTPVTQPEPIPGLVGPVDFTGPGPGVGPGANTGPVGGQPGQPTPGGGIPTSDPNAEAARQAEISRLAEEAARRNTPSQAELDAAQNQQEGIIPPVDPNQFKTPNTTTTGTVQPTGTGPGTGPIAQPTGGGQPAGQPNFLTQSLQGLQGLAQSGGPITQDVQNRLRAENRDTQDVRAQNAIRALQERQGATGFTNSGLTDFGALQARLGAAQNVTRGENQIAFEAANTNFGANLAANQALGAGALGAGQFGLDFNALQNQMFQQNRNFGRQLALDEFGTGLAGQNQQIGILNQLGNNIFRDAQFQRQGELDFRDLIFGQHGQPGIPQTSPGTTVNIG